MNDTKEPWLEEGEYICSQCNGTGNLSNTPIFGTCPKCSGDGKVDWIENIVGKDRNRKPGVTIKEIDLSHKVSKFYYQ